MTTQKDFEGEVISWAAGTLQAQGAMMYPTPDGWDVEMPDGSWRAANNWRELADVAREVSHA